MAAAVFGIIGEAGMRPLGWTGSSDEFDYVRGVLLLEL